MSFMHFGSLSGLGLRLVLLVAVLLAGQGAASAAPYDLAAGLGGAFGAAPGLLLAAGAALAVSGAVVGFWFGRRSRAGGASSQDPAPVRDALAAVLASLPLRVRVFDLATKRLLASNDGAGEGAAPGPRFVEAEEDLLRPDGSAFAPDERPLARLLADGEEVRGERVLLRAATGETRAYELSAARVADGAGRPALAVVALRDLEAFRRAEEDLEQGKARLRLAIRAAELGPFEFDLRTETFTWSAMTATITGIAADQTLTFEQFLERVHPDDYAEVSAAKRNLLDTGTGDFVRFRFRHGDGGWRWLVARGILDFDPPGVPRRVIGFIQDETPPREAQEALRLSEARYRSLADALPQMVWLTRPDGDAFWSNTGLRRYYGDVDMSLASRLDRIHPDDVDAIRAAREDAYARKTTFQAELRLRRHDGAYRWHRVTLLPFFRDGEVTEWLGTALDIHDLRQAEEALRDREARLRSLADNLPESMLYQMAVYPDGSYRFLQLTANCERLTGVTAEAALADPRLLLDQIADEYRSRYKDAVRRALETGSTMLIDLPRRADGRAMRWIRIAAQPRRLRDGTIMWDGVFTDITTAKENEIALRRSEERMRLSQEAGHVVAWELDLVSRMPIWSEANYILWGLAPAATITFADVLARVHTEDRSLVETEVAAAIARGRLDVEYRIARPDGEVRWLSTRGKVEYDQAGRAVRMFGVDIDVTERREAQEVLAHLNAVLEEKIADATRRLREEMAERRRVELQLHQAQKLEAIGRLTGGVAHDLNNKLQVVSANVDGVARRLRHEPHLRQGLISALVATDRATGLISKLLAFARRQELKTEIVDVEERLASILELVDRSLTGDAIEVRLDVDETVWPVLADPNELESAIVNLAVNARDAMPDGGLIEIEARNCFPFEAPNAEVKLVGDCVRITVRDTGIGIPPEVLDHVFEPFFTTKEIGKGTGLGLSQVYGFVLQLGGAVTVDSAVGEGTTVSLFLPRASVDARIGARREGEDWIEDEGPQVRSSRILIVDDEPDVATALQVLLEQMGYQVRIAIGAEEALTALEQERPDIMLTDIAMPGGIDGLALARRVRRSDPSLPILMITGNPRTAGTQDGFPTVLKPITSPKLDHAIQALLTGERRSAVVTPLRRSGPGDA